MSIKGWGRADWDRLATLFEGVCPVEPLDGTLAGMVRGAPYSGYKPGTVEAPNGDTKECADCKGVGCAHGARCPSVWGGDEDCEDCPACLGRGRVPNLDAGGTCGWCAGDGKARWPYSDGTLGPCEACKGSGRVAGKRYLHVADKYTDAPDWARAYHDRAYAHAARVATALGVPAAYSPRPEYGALRVLEYPAGAGSVVHTDLDLFSVVCWRETPEDLERGNVYWDSRRDKGEALSPGLHIGEIGKLVGLGPATPHRVPARPYVQRSIVYFAIPDHAARLPNPHDHRTNPMEFVTHKPVTVGEWLAERMARSRYEASR